MKWLKFIAIFVPFSAALTIAGTCGAKHIKKQAEQGPPARISREDALELILARNGMQALQQDVQRLVQQQQKLAARRAELMRKWQMADGSGVDMDACAGEPSTCPINRPAPAKETPKK